MAIARRDILPDQSFAHCTWRCLNREFLLTDRTIKDFIVETWRRFAMRYHVKILEYCILDNHVHMVVRCLTAGALGNFMRVCNSQIALFINKRLCRDSHALRERYKSPLIEGAEYFKNTLVYVWLNYFKATGVKPLDYKYGSAFYRARGQTNRDLLAAYDDAPIDESVPLQRFVIDLINAAMSKQKMVDLGEDVFEHGHTIGPSSFVKERSRYFASLKKERPS